MAPTQIVCSCCSKLYDAAYMIKCCICKKQFKNSCVDISSAEARLLNSNKGCDWSCKVCRSFGNDIKDLKALILKLQDDIQAFKTTRSDDATLNRNEFLEEVISELSERNKRRKNVIIFGVPEQDANDDGDTADKDKVTDILHTIDRNFSLQDVKIVRLGLKFLGLTGTFSNSSNVSSPSITLQQ
nr:unnamed protein product [Callosobruchus chinensis]